MASTNCPSMANLHTCNPLLYCLLVTWLFGSIYFLKQHQSLNHSAVSRAQAASRQADLPHYLTPYIHPSVDNLQNHHQRPKAKQWEEVYVEHIGARMPYEELNRLVEKYWPDKTETKANLKRQKPKTQTTGSTTTRINGKSVAKADTDTLADAVQVNDVSGYPSGWQHPCAGHADDLKCILKAVRYWHSGVAAQANAIAAGQVSGQAQDKYVTFLRDCGGFNNIRQGFEFHVMIAWLTKRTLVLPPDKGWYLIDYGQIVRGKPLPNTKKVSKFGHFFDIEDMKLAVAVITAEEFVQKEIERLSIPVKFCCGALKDVKVGKDFEQWLNEYASNHKAELHWGQLANVLMWPDTATVDDLEHNTNEHYNTVQRRDMFVDKRKKREYTAHLKSERVVHFPACRGGSQANDLRYLGQIARAVAFATGEQDREWKRVLRDFVHLKSEIFTYAAQIVAAIGGIFEFSSLHIRRNELQYKYVFCSAEETWRNVQPLLRANEVLYIATDEPDEAFFDVFRSSGHVVYRWNDLSKLDGVRELLSTIPPKIHGEVEMAVCCMGRLFFGTKESTFSAYIARLRGYVKAPYARTLYHHVAMTGGDVVKSEKDSLAWKWGKSYRGQIYKVEFPDLWLDIY